MSDPQDDDALARLAAELGLERAYRLDPDGFAQAVRSARALRASRTASIPAALEPAATFDADRHRGDR